jgi:Phage P22-like portal protein
LLPTDPAGTKTQQFLQLAQDRFRLVAESEAQNRRDSLDDLAFSIGDQWPMDIRSRRQIDGRPCLTVNRLPQFIRQVTNEQRQQRPAIQINPIGSDSDVDTAEILQGIIRHIEVNSHAEEAYDGSFDSMVRIGFGCWRIITDWIAPESEDQEIYIVPIDNPFTVYLDPTNKRDPNWGFIIEDLLASQFKHDFPESKYANGTAGLTEYESVGDSPANWAQTVDGNPSIRIAEYFTVEKSKGDKGRQTREVRWSKISALDVLDGYDPEKEKQPKSWAGKYIPIVKIYGDDLIINGKRHVSGLVRHAKDPQRAYNYWISAATERIALAPKAPWLIAEGQIEGHEMEWKQSNVRNLATLSYKPISSSGQQVPPPQRNVVEPGIQGMTEMLQMASQDMQTTTGLYPNNLGQQQTQNESGKAVLARQKQGDIATLNFSDNAARGIEHCGTIILDLIPKVYTSARIQRIVKPDETVSNVGVFNSQTEDAADAMERLSVQDPALTKIYDIGVGRYDVAVSVGPSYQSKRQEAVAAQLALVSAVPQIMPAIGDLIVGNMDWPQSKEISKRLKKLLPPQLQDDEDTSPEAQLMQAQQQLAALGQQHQQLTQALQQATEVIKTKQVENQGKIAIEQHKGATQMSIEQMKIDAQIAIAEINTKAQNAIERAKMFNDIWTELHGTAHEVGMAGIANQAAAQQQQAGAQADQQSQTSDQMHEVGMSAMNAARQPEEGAQQ